jgi:hypothetical protein
MRNKINVSKNIDFVKSLNINQLSLIRIEKDVSNLLSKEKPFTGIIKLVWNDKKYSDNEICYLIFSLGQAQARKEAFDKINSSLGNLDLDKIMKHFKDE